MSDRDPPPTEFSSEVFRKPGDESETRTDAAISKLLGLGLRPSDQPFDFLIERLCAPDGPAWLSSRVDAVFEEPSGWFADHVVSGGVSLADLESLKQSAKSLYHRASSKGTSLLALAGYFLAVAAALVHHGSYISGRDRTEVRTAFLDLADVLPEPWKPVLTAAAEQSEA